MFKSMITLSISLLSIAPLLATPTQLDSFPNGHIWPDNNGKHINAHGGGILFDQNTYYWFGEHKVEGNEGNYAQVGVHCYSSKDLYNWKDEGIALHVVTDSESHPITKGCILERPKVIYNAKTKKYVMWFHLELKGRGYGSAYSGVATADTVVGPYKFYRAGRANPGQWPINYPDSEKHLLAGPAPKLSGSAFNKDMDYNAFLKRDFKEGQMQRDMTLFVDDDGMAYHIYSSEENGTTHIAQLTDDYLHHNGVYARAFVGRFMEAPAVTKRKNKYYFVGSGCTGWAPNAGRSAVADHIMGPWTELDNPFVGKDAHISFGSQSTYFLKVEGKEDSFVLLNDMWRPKNAIDGRYLWLPVKFDGDQIILNNVEKAIY